MHLDKAKVNFVLQSIKEGLRLGCDKPVTLKSARKNKLLAYQHSGVIDVYLANEVRRGHVVGPFDSPPMQNLHISSFGVITKKEQPVKWRLIVDLSSPQGHSVNDGIDPDSWHLQYIKRDDIIKVVSKFGPGALMAKFDRFCIQEYCCSSVGPLSIELEVAQFLPHGPYLTIRTSFSSGNF